jgi:hypothetical protein
MFRYAPQSPTVATISHPSDSQTLRNDRQATLPDLGKNAHRTSGTYITGISNFAD